MRQSRAARARAWIPDRTKLVADVLKRCDHCQFARRENSPTQPLHLMPRPPAFERWAFDFVGPLPKTRAGNAYLLTAMDHGTGIISAHGAPLSVLTDNGEEFFASTNGRLEKFNDVLVTMLARFTSPNDQERWDQHIVVLHGLWRASPSPPRYLSDCGVSTDTRRTPRAPSSSLRARQKPCSIPRRVQQPRPASTRGRRRQARRLVCRTRLCNWRPRQAQVGATVEDASRVGRSWLCPQAPV
ncbi:hypothetical protein EXIGLDRAFT_444335 [Exidia glandulosa HHB12029]|uniref:Integrase catalytic domain-containing protein n=1 Tax=Exidia glandulosa HHB12029 TaxID=1314781 RepID=A0A165B6A9_EXIGL|nr:hypothetical protein EXIGLDRAFT_444335 [Exidia glandulosa HHB12029]